MPRTIKIPEGASPLFSSGIEITWTPSASRLDIKGWKDNFAEIPPKSIKLAEFFKRLGITEKDIQRALKSAAKAKRKSHENQNM